MAEATSSACGGRVSAFPPTARTLAHAVGGARTMIGSSIWLSLSVGGIFSGGGGGSGTAARAFSLEGRRSVPPKPSPRCDPSDPPLELPAAIAAVAAASVAGDGILAAPASSACLGGGSGTFGATASSVASLPSCLRRGAEG